MKLHKITAVLLLICIVLTSCNTKAEDLTPVFSYSYETDFKNSASDTFNIFPYGNLSFMKNGITGRSVSLKGGYLQIEQSDKIDIIDSFTFATWLNFNEFLSYNPIIFGKESSDGVIDGGPISIYFADDYTTLQCDLTFLMKDEEFKSYSFIAQKAVKKGMLFEEWNHFAFVLNKDKVKFYLNSKEIYSASLPDDIKGYRCIAVNNKPFTMGRSIYHNMTAAYDDTILYTNALSDKDIKQLYNKPIAGFENEIHLTEGSDVIKNNSQKVVLPLPIERNTLADRIMVPAKALCDQMGAVLTWDGNDNLGRMDITYKDNRVSLWMFNSNASVNSVHTKVEPFPTSINNIAMVPLRFLAESLGCIVRWDEESKSIVLYY